ncbi:MAG TPA: sigma-54 dependent transcriptional regulator [Balneolales bacterium]|nr:sigma-54 dependent transcriptional regulator [Balneolales bacterium]
MSERNGKILIIDDDDDVLRAGRLFLKQYVEKVETEKDPKYLPKLLQENSYDAILLDMNFEKSQGNGEEGFYWLQRILEMDPSTVVILITAYGDTEMAVRAIKEGATDFILKPWQNEKLLATVSSAIQLRKSRQEVNNLRSRQRQMNEDLDRRYREMIGKSQAMQEIFRTIDKVAATDANILILGENGTGKELVARALHRQSKRSGEAFINVDMGALNQNLFESELFGYVKGAFTDAREDRPGRFEIASGGSLFLDEIGNIPLPLQAKLLTVLQQRQVTRLGSHKTSDIDIRLICATNMNIHQMVADGSFRQDLLYRINTIEINLPTLRNRTMDIPLLTHFYLDQYVRKYDKHQLKISDQAMIKLKNYAWPGNIRELQHAVERAVIMSESDTLQPYDFILTTHDQQGNNEPMKTLNLDQIEKSTIRKALKEYGGNISQAADALGITRPALYRRMEKYDL